MARSGPLPQHGLGYDLDHMGVRTDTLGCEVCSRFWVAEFQSFAWYLLGKRATLVPEWYQLLVLSTINDLPETQNFVCWPCGGPKLHWWKQAGKSLAFFVGCICCWIGIGEVLNNWKHPPHDILSYTYKLKEQQRLLIFIFVKPKDWTSFGWQISQSMVVLVLMIP